MLVLLRNEQTWEDQTNCSLTEEQTYSARSMSTNVHQVPTHLERGLHEVQVYPVFMMEALNVKSMSVMEPAALWTTGHVHDPKDSGAMELSLCVCLWFQILNWRTAKSQGQLGLQIPKEKMSILKTLCQKEFIKLLQVETVGSRLHSRLMWWN